MKYIKATIRPEKFDSVRDALYHIGIEFFTYTDVTGVSFQQEQKYSYRGRTLYDSGKVTLRVVDVIVPDEDASEVIEVIKKSAQTGMVGDGKIFMWDLEHSERISK
ncbi:MAG: P-II family nitrogen regulator [Cytophagales bacterium]